MLLFDSHCHIDDKVYNKDIDAVIKRANDAGVRYMIIVGINNKSSRKALEIARLQDGIYSSVGVHPHDVKKLDDSKLKELIELSKDDNVKAWGEIGLDFNRMYSKQHDQEKWFIKQLDTAISLNLPVIFHERDSRGRLIEILKSDFNNKVKKAVVHCFSGTEKELKCYLNLDFYIGITGIITLKERGKILRELAVKIPENRILIETDAPYLTPAPQKNKYKRNEPAFVKSVMLEIAKVRGKDPEQLGASIWENTCRFIGTSL